MALSPRSMQVLSAVVEIYTKTGEPVGSKAVCEWMEHACSSATIRNVMSELGELGYLEQPHTSAGRIPSPKGYRLYVDKLMKPYELTAADKSRLRALLPRQPADVDELLGRVGEALAELTKCAAVATTPVDGEARVQRVDVIPLGRHILLLAMTISTGSVKSRAIRLVKEPTVEQLEHFLKVVNLQLVGERLDRVTPASAQTTACALGLHAFDLTLLLDALIEMAQEACSSQLCLGGESNLLMHREYDGDNARRLLQFLSRKDQLASFLFRHAQNPQVVIGTETEEDALNGSAVVTAGYGVQGRPMGHIGVIGPLRMDYYHIVPSVAYFASELGKILKDALNSDDGQ